MRKFKYDLDASEDYCQYINSIVNDLREKLTKLENVNLTGRPENGRILRNTRELFEILAKTHDKVISAEGSGNLIRFKTMSDNVYPGRYAKNSYLILSCRSDSGMDDCRHARKMKYRRWRIERKNHEVIQKYRKNSLKRGGHFLLLTEIRLLNSFGDLKNLTIEELAMSIRHVEKFGDHRDGSKPFSIIAHLCVHFETVLSSAILVKENQIKIKKENTKFKKIANNLVFLAEKFGPEVTLREALERLDGANVIDLNERKKVA